MVSCPVCPEEQPNNILLLEHIKERHDANRPYFCHKCDEHFSRAAIRDRHETRAHGFKPAPKGRASRINRTGTTGKMHAKQIQARRQTSISSMSSLSSIETVATPLPYEYEMMSVNAAEAHDTPTTGSPLESHYEDVIVVNTTFASATDIHGSRDTGISGFSAEASPIGESSPNQHVNHVTDLDFPDQYEQNGPPSPKIHEQMRMHGTGTPVIGGREKAFPPVISTDQTDPLTAEMIGDLLMTLSPKQYSLFENQRTIMYCLASFDDVELHMPYSNEPFACDACGLGFPDLDAFVVHMHADHFVGPTDQCKCALCKTIFGDDHLDAINDLFSLYNWWKSKHAALKQQDHIPAFLLSDHTGHVVLGPRSYTECVQDMALSALWGDFTLAYGKTPFLIDDGIAMEQVP